jgi:hypothetical protein
LLDISRKTTYQSLKAKIIPQRRKGAAFFYGFRPLPSLNASALIFYQKTHGQHHTRFR